MWIVYNIIMIYIYYIEYDDKFVVNFFELFNANIIKHSIPELIECENFESNNKLHHTILLNYYIQFLDIIILLEEEHKIITDGVYKDWQQWIFTTFENYKVLTKDVSYKEIKNNKFNSLNKRDDISERVTKLYGLRKGI